MSGKNGETGAPDGAEAKEDKQERGLYWRRVRRRTTGIAAVFLLIGMLWQLGDSSRPPQIAPLAPSAEPFSELVPNEKLREVAAELESAEEFSSAPELIPAADAEEQSEQFSAAAEENKESESAELNAAPVAESESFAPPALSELSAPPPVADGDGENDFSAAAQESPFAVQVGAFRKKSGALSIARKLRADGYAVKLSNEDESLFRVRAIGFNTRAEAEMAKREILAAGYAEAAVRDQR